MVYTTFMVNNVQLGERLKDALNLSYLFYSGYKHLSFGENSYESGHYLSVIFAESGNLTLKYQGLQLEVPELNAVFIPPQTAYTLTCENLKARIFSCEFSLASRIPVDLDGKLFFISGIKLPLMKRIIRSSLNSFPDGNWQSKVKQVDPIDEHLIKNCIELFVIDCINSGNKPIIDKNYPIAGKGESAKTALKIYEYLSLNLNRNITLEEVADELFFSVSYVKTVFKKHTGKSVIDAFNEMKIERAKKLIKKGIRFSEIANQLAFSSSQYFSRIFKRHVGITPMEYKKSLSK